MKRLMNLLRGTVALCVTGPFPERLLNLCAQHRLDFWRLEWLDDHTVRFTARRSQFRRLEALAERVECEISVEQRRGLPDFLLRFRARYAFLAGLALALGAVAFLSRFVLTIQVSGNERLPTAVHLTVDLTMTQLLIARLTEEQRTLQRGIVAGNHGKTVQ